MDRTHSANVLGVEDGSLSQPPPRASRRPPFPSSASREVPGGVDTGGWVTTGGQQRPFADPTRSSSQLSQRRPPLGAGRRGGRRVLGVHASPRSPLLSSPGISTEPRGRRPRTPATGGGDHGWRRARAVGGRNPGSPLPAGPPLPAAAPEPCGAEPPGQSLPPAPAVRLKAAERKVRWARAGRRGVAGGRPRESALPPSALLGLRAPAGEGALARAPAAVAPPGRDVWAVRGPVGSAAPWAAATVPGGCPAGPLASWCPFPSRLSGTCPAGPGDGSSLREVVPAQTRASRPGRPDVDLGWGVGPGRGRGRWDFPQARPGAWREQGRV